MGLISRFLKLFERRDLSVTDDRAWGVGSMDTAAGTTVDHDKAVGLSEIFAAVKNCAEDLAALPFPTYRRGPDGSRERIDDHYTQELLEDAPNPYMTGQEMREALQGQVELRGNAYAEIERDGAGRPVRLWPLRADCVEPFMSPEGALFYAVRWHREDPKTRPEGRILPARLVWHLHGFGSTGLMGCDPITTHREGIGHALAMQEYGARFFRNGSRPGGVLQHPGKPSPEARKNLRESWELAHSGLQQAHRVALLEEGITWQQVSIAPENAQYIESRKMKVSDAARIWRYPAHMLGDMSASTNNNIEQQALEYVSYTLLPRAKRIEGRVRLSLLADTERRSVFVEHLFAGLLRGDAKTRFEAYSLGRQWGWLSVNDIRRLENMNSIGPDGDIYLSPLNMVPADQASAAVAQADGPLERMLEAVASNGRSLEAMEQRMTRWADEPRVSVTVPERHTTVNVQPASVRVEPRFEFEPPAVHVAVPPPEVRVDVAAPQVTVQHPTGAAQRVFRDAAHEIERTETVYEFAS